MPVGVTREGLGPAVPAPGSWPDGVTSADEHGSVLVASDDPELRERVSRPLAEHGFHLVEAVSAHEALALARCFLIDVAVIHAPKADLDVAELLRRWREVEHGEYVPVLLVADSRDPEVVEAGIHLGAHDYILPPFDTVDVLARTHSALEAKRRDDGFRRRVTELQHLVRTDTLTGLYTRRHIEAELTALASAARRRHTPLGLLLVDVDRFKRINDKISHDAGDEALKTVARRLRSIVRTEDVVGRWGGDEFVVLLPSTGRDAAVVLAQRLRRAVATLAGEPPRVVPLTVSVGCAAADDPEESALVSAADAALRRAKAGGRNRVSL